MIRDIFLISLSSSPFLLVLILLSPFIRKKFSAGTLCAIYTIFALRLAVPVRLPVFTFESEKTADYLPSQPQIVPPEPETTPPHAAPQPDPAPKDFEKKPDIIPFLYISGALFVFFRRISALLVFNIRIKKSLVYMFDFKNLKVYKSCRISSAVLTGFFAPRIILPDAKRAKDEEEMILSHEYAHYKRGDIWRKLLLTAALALHFFNPLAHIMCACANKAIEYACDEYVTRGKDLSFCKNYSNAILKSIKIRNGEE